MHQNAAKIAELVKLDAPGWLGNSVTWVVDSDHGWEFTQTGAPEHLARWQKEAG